MKINLNAFVLVGLFVFCNDVTCVASVSVRFRTKERGTTVNSIQINSKKVKNTPRDFDDIRLH